ncbi:Plasmodium exported protein, unknown function [Plasmodium reichenowi]|uniref:Plasmodium RESA N-terminal domain-containing protein n=1 Tax=Plasmodium reichenowi TaxID=5854 RepID=A0A060RMV1_PLARE|nr:Plasmodium exported protein, unknown function [Plasmodium reichenowi]
MRNNEKYNIFSMYNADENQKGKVHYISFKYLCWCLYIIGFYCLLLSKSLRNCSYGIVNISNVYERNLGEVEEYNYWPQRKSYLKYKKEDVNKIKSNINKRKYNEQMVEKYENIINKNLWIMNMEKENYNHINNMNYNDISKNLTEKELRNVLDSLGECPSKDDLINIWFHTLGIAKDGFDNILNVLKASIEKYADKNILKYISSTFQNKHFLYDNIWTIDVFSFCRTVGDEELAYTKKFFSLINGKHTLDDVLKFIYSFLERFDKLKKELHEEYQEEILRKVAKTMNKKKKN